MHQVQALKQIFMLVVQTLQQFLLTELNLLSRDDISALARLLSLAEQILNWDFSHHHILLGEVRFLFVSSQCRISEILRFIQADIGGRKHV